MPATRTLWSLTRPSSNVLDGATPSVFPAADDGILRWVHTVTDGWRVIDLIRLRTGSSWTDRLLLTRRGAVSLLVLRRHHRADWLRRRPGIVVEEAAALLEVARLGLPTPRLVAFDPSGVDAGVPSILSTWLPGSSMSAAIDGRGLCRLVEVLHRLHGHVPVRMSTEYSPWYDVADVVPPGWRRHRPVWERALEIVAAGPPPEPAVMLHRDFHPGNVLWSDNGAVSGVVDWLDGCAGPAGADLGHCRRDLVTTSGGAAADRLLSVYGGDLHPYWDLVSVTDLLHDVGDELDQRLEAFVCRAVSRA